MILDFWQNNKTDFDPIKALEILEARYESLSKAQARKCLRLSLFSFAKETKSILKTSIFAAFSSMPVVSLDAAGIEIDSKTISIYGFLDSIEGMMELDLCLTEAGALRRTPERNGSHRSTVWLFITDTELARVPLSSAFNMVAGQRKGLAPGAQQVSVPVPAMLAKHIPAYLSPRAMVGLAVECGRRGITETQLRAFLAGNNECGTTKNQNNYND